MSKQEDFAYCAAQSIGTITGTEVQVERFDPNLADPRQQNPALRSHWELYCEGPSQQRRLFGLLPGTPQRKRLAIIYETVERPVADPTRALDGVLFLNTDIGTRAQDLLREQAGLYGFTDVDLR